MWVWLPEGRDSLISGYRRATVMKTDDSGSQQILKEMQGLASEVFSDVYRAQPHGFSSHAPKGSEGFFHALGGRSDRLIALGFEHKDKRPRNLPEGGVALYDADGKLLRMIKDGTDWDFGAKPFTAHNVTKITITADDKIVIESKKNVVVKAPRVDLGDEGGVPVSLCGGGCATKVFAV